ncbi:hypothetical protein PT189_07430 [Erysipelothrix rhusiopathiae]|uniref:hypothetical protein n=1 Tax=Erysipelothrix rhusiopathiae TaxID=1648 RepID=UPI0023B1099C|nr:hypothetical protein [Erysipelothrix rhusiopathiae]MDE8041786.1 hypothetical protein [Erysipelothrix rhusiopathiae]MDE8050299.1 hypothetical protein [Erysipelothrix rhusiopathiae]MDE8058055.1 hypothetical protein [Erysipelothrix rhusiopathiae]MDE8066988.1 hypothetical protein [Erysipelothrix rhusiopathiae]
MKILCEDKNSKINLDLIQNKLNEIGGFGLDLANQNLANNRDFKNTNPDHFEITTFDDMVQPYFDSLIHENQELNKSIRSLNKEITEQHQIINELEEKSITVEKSTRRFQIKLSIGTTLLGATLGFIFSSLVR